MCIYKTEESAPCRLTTLGYKHDGVFGMTDIYSHQIYLAQYRPNKYMDLGHNQTSKWTGQRSKYHPIRYILVINDETTVNIFL